MRLLYLLVFAFMLTGCGLGSENVINEPNSGGSETVEGDMAVRLDENSSFIFNYEVVNQADKDMTLEFSSSQRIDYSVSTKEGEEVYLFSSVATFLQAIGEEVVKPGEKLAYTIDLNDLNLVKGEYILSVWMTPMDGAAYKVIKEFKVE